LKKRRRELGDPKIQEHRGHIIKTTGDGMLVEFASWLPKSEEYYQADRFMPLTSMVAADGSNLILALRWVLNRFVALSAIVENGSSIGNGADVTRESAYRNRYRTGYGRKGQCC
jgi:class 3 adenylate cyclase